MMIRDDIIRLAASVNAGRVLPLTSFQSQKKSGRIERILFSRA